MNPYIPILIVLAVAGGLSGLLIFLSRLLGPKKPAASKLSVYECGLEPVKDARQRFSVKFYLVAILFIVFDVEIVFLYPWAVNYKDAVGTGDGVYMILVMTVFFLLLVLGLLYEWRKGALEWGEKR